MKTPELLKFLSVVSALTVTTLNGQTVTPVSQDSTDEDIVQLSKFEVTAEASRGYVTTSSMSASRITVPITELPASLVVINEKLIADTMALEFRDTMSLVSGIQQSAQPMGTSAISMRGYTLSGAQRDGVTDHLMTSSENTSNGFDYALAERIEIVKGPSGVLYGAHNPGGIVNIVSKRPLSRPQTKITATVGSWNMYRAELDSSNFFDEGKQFGYRLVAVRHDTDGWVDDRPNKGDGMLALNPSISFRSKNGWNVWLWSAIVRDHLKRSTVGTPMLPTDPNFSYPSNPSEHGAPIYGVKVTTLLSNMRWTDTELYEVGVSKSFDLGPVSADVRLLGRDFNQRGEGASRIRGIDAFDLVFDKSGKFIGRDYRAIPYSVAVGNVGMSGREAVRYDYDPFEKNGQLGSADVNFSYRNDFMHVQTLLYGTMGSQVVQSSTSSYDIRNPATLSAMGFPTIDGRVVVLTYPSPTFVPTPEQMIRNADRLNIGRETRNQVDDSSYGGLARVSFWDDRIFFVAGYRKDIQDSVTDTYSNGTLVASNTNDVEVGTDSLAALVKVYKGTRGEASVFVNANSTFIPVTAIDTRLATFGEKYPNRVADNDEFGLKLDMWQSRLVATVAVFKTTETNVLVTHNDETGSITGIPSSFYRAPVGTRTTKGWEADINFAPTPGWEFILAYSKNDPRLEDGTYAQQIAFNTFTGAVRHEVQSGPLKGLSAMWQYNQWGKSALSSRSYWIVPGGNEHALMLGYPIGRNWTVRARISNLLDTEDVYPSPNETALDTSQPRTYRMSVTYTF